MLILALLLAAQAIDVKELAEFRLSAAGFERFVSASHAVGRITRDDAAFVAAPLFSRELLVLDDAVAAAAALQARLEEHAQLRHALDAAKMPPREYIRFAIALVAARLAHGFMQSGALRLVPPGPAADNVAFVAAHLDAIRDVLRELGIDDAPEQP
jgi:hypothetical protein